MEQKSDRSDRSDMSDAPVSPEAADLMPRELVRIFTNTAGQILYKYRGGIGDARIPVATVLAAIDRQMLADEIMARLAPTAP